MVRGIPEHEVLEVYTVRAALDGLAAGRVPEHPALIDVIERSEPDLAVRLVHEHMARALEVRLARLRRDHVSDSSA